MNLCVSGVSLSWSEFSKGFCAFHSSSVIIKIQLWIGECQTPAKSGTNFYCNIAKVQSCWMNILFSGAFTKL